MKAVLPTLAAIPLLWAAPAAVQSLDTSDLFVPWTSTLPMDAGQVVGLHLRHTSLEWLQRGTALGQSSGEIAADKAR